MPNGDGTGPLGKGCGNVNQSRMRRRNCAEGQFAGNENLKKGLHHGKGSMNGAGNGICAGRKQMGNSQTRNY